jgi:hypothetical protein
MAVPGPIKPSPVCAAVLRTCCDLVAPRSDGESEMDLPKKSSPDHRATNHLDWRVLRFSQRCQHRKHPKQRHHDGKTVRLWGSRPVSISEINLRLNKSPTYSKILKIAVYYYYYYIYGTPATRCNYTETVQTAAVFGTFFSRYATQGAASEARRVPLIVPQWYSSTDPGLQRSRDFRSEASGSPSLARSDLAVPNQGLRRGGQSMYTTFPRARRKTFFGKHDLSIKKHPERQSTQLVL